MISVVLYTSNLNRPVKVLGVLERHKSFYTLLNIRIKDLTFSEFDHQMI